MTAIVFESLTNVSPPKVVENSLKLLKTELISITSIGLIQTCRLKMLAGAIKDLIRQGKVLHFGLSEASAKTIRRAHASSRLRQSRLNT